MLEHIERILMAANAEVVWGIHCDLMAQYGFDRLLYGFIPFRSSPGADDMEDVLILSNHDPAYLEEFLRSDVFQSAPMVRWTAESCGPVAASWRIVQERAARGELTPAEMEALALNRRHGVRAGISISFNEAALRSCAGIGLCAEAGLTQDDVDEIWARNERELMALNMVVHLRISTLPIIRSRRVLTERQREVLEWVADGKTTSDIALIMGLTAATVEKHLRLAREALDVETTAQAVLKATMQRQIFMGARQQGGPGRGRAAVRTRPEK